MNVTQFTKDQQLNMAIKPGTRRVLYGTAVNPLSATDTCAAQTASTRHSEASALTAYYMTPASYGTLSSAVRDTVITDLF